jgi:hypothetical protein
VLAGLLVTAGIDFYWGWSSAGCSSWSWFFVVLDWAERHT